ncbi:MAG: glycosyl hydrolase family 18 protein [Bacteroidaceae bacterium]
MKHIKLVDKVALSFRWFVFLFLLISPNLAINAQITTKKIDTWYLYTEGKSSFQELVPFKDIIASISVFGNPPKSFIEECHQNQIEVYHAVSGDEKSIDSSAKRKIIAEEYLRICDTMGYDGIDLDFEALNPQVKEMYSLFLFEISEKLHHAGKKLSQCVGFYNSLYQNDFDHLFYDVKVVSSTCDLIRVMCYDMYYAPGRFDKSLLNRVDCQGVGATSHYPFAKEAMKFWLTYVSSDKLVMGLPAYSNDYEMTNNGKGRQIYGSVPQNVKGVLPAPTWLWFEKINIYTYSDTNDCPHLFYASDERSTESLLHLADELKIQKIGFWHFGSVDPKIWTVTQKWISTARMLPEL